MKVFCIIIAVLFLLLGLIFLFIPEIRWSGIGLLIGGLLFIVFSILADKGAKYRKILHKAINGDPRLINAKLFHPIGGTIAISESGYVGFKNDKIKENIKVLHINDIKGFNLDINGNTQHNTGGAITGGLLFGAVGAIIGGQNIEMITKLSLIFKIDDFNNPNIEIPFILFKIKKGSYEHKQALDMVNEISSLLELLERKYKQSSI